MSQERTYGLQWRLALVYLAVGTFSSAAVAAGYLAGIYLGLPPNTALAVGAAAGFGVGLAGAVAGSMIARSVKLRLWEAGRMAGRIAGGDFRARLNPGFPDEVGWLEAQLNQMAGQLETAVGELRNLAEQNRRLGEEAGRGFALEERARLARDLHDTVNQQLFALTMRTAAARRRLEQLGGETAALIPEMDSLEELARQAHSETRDLILQLRPVTLEQQGLAAALKDYVTQAAAREGWAVVEEIDRSIHLDGRAAENLFRIAQEALNNTAKHASARTVRLKLARGVEGILLSIVDDGAGFDHSKGFRPTAVGLSGIRERVAAMKGRFSVESAPGRGTEITVVVPVDMEGGDA